MKTALSNNRSCENCAFAEGCNEADIVITCSEHKFDWEVEDISEAEKRADYGDYLYQCYKEQ